MNKHKPTGSIYAIMELSIQFNFCSCNLLNSKFIRFMCIWWQTSEYVYLRSSLSAWTWFIIWLTQRKWPSKENELRFSEMWKILIFENMKFWQMINLSILKWKSLQKFMELNAVICSYFDELLILEVFDILLHVTFDLR